MKRIIFFVCICFICINHINGQTNFNTLLPDVLPTNPQTSEFMKYGEIPVGNYTGTPNISIPIYNLKTKSLEIPISLSYHPNGIKVNEEASWVGLGWNLNTDMQIVQTIVGFDDFGYYGNRLTPNYSCLIPTQAGGLSASGVMSGCQTFFLGFDDQWNQNHPDCFFSPTYFAGIKDSEPDIFYFNALGYSGKFMLDWQNGNYICLTDKRIKITSDSSSNNSRSLSFFISVPDGHKFFFDLKEESKINRSHTTAPTGGGVPTNVDLVNRNEKSSRVYKLTAVLTNKAEVINFNYTTTAISKNFPNINITYRNYKRKDGAGSNFGPVDKGHSVSFLATEQPFSYLSSITYEDLEVKFLTSSRVDLKEARKLDKIEVRHKTKLINDYTFSYDYFSGNYDGNNWDSYLSDQNYNHGKTTTELTHRLKLNSFKFKTQKPYTFEYNSISLPKKTSYATDYWGYYNGQHNNTSFFPNIYRFNIERDNANYLKYEDNNKSANINFTRASTLLKVVYPTGGVTHYNYELNSFGNYKAPSTTYENKQSFSISTPTNQASNPTKTILIKGGPTFFKGSALLSVRGCSNIELNTAYADTYVKVYSFKESLIPIVESNQYYSLDHALYSLGLLRNSSNFNQTNFNQYIDREEIIQMQQNGDLEQHFSDLLYTFNKGVVRFETYGGCGTYNGTINSSQAFLNLTYMDYQPLAGDSYGAGLRIKTIVNYTKAPTSRGSLPATKKTYEYEGGKLMSPLLYFTKTRVTLESQKFLYYANCDEEQYIGYEIDNAWQNFNENPTQSNANIVIDLQNDMIDSGCSPVFQKQHFHGDKNELYSGSYIQPSISASGKYVGYDKVSIKSYNNYGNSNTDGNGKIENHYTNIPDQGAFNGTVSGNGYFTAVNVPLIKSYPENGLLLKQEFFNDNSNVPKQGIYNTYFAEMEDCFWGMKTIPTDTYLRYITGSDNMYEPQRKYLTGVYPIKRGVSLLKKQTSIFYDTNNLTRETIYFYDDKNQLTSSKETNSKNEEIETKIKYPYNYTVYPYTHMVTNNSLTNIIEKETKLNSERVQLDKFDYNIQYISDTDTYIYPINKYSQAKGSQPLIDRIIYHNYDNKGNPTEVSKKDGTKIYYVWGYNKTHLIAKIEGYISFSSAQHTAINNAITASNRDTSQATEDLLLDKLKLLQDSFNTSTAQVTSLTYDPLIGVTSVTDPRGQTIYYHYDDFNRLEFVKDKEGNILSKNEYNYKN